MTRLKLVTTETGHPSVMICRCRCVSCRWTDVHDDKSFRCPTRVMYIFAGDTGRSRRFSFLCCAFALSLLSTRADECARYCRGARRSVCFLCALSSFLLRVFSVYLWICRGTYRGICWFLYTVVYAGWSDMLLLERCFFLLMRGWMIVCVTRRLMK